jgi:hypothetical protein
MAKWADYVITCVNYTSDGDRISTVGVHVDNGDSVGERKTWHRDQVVRELAQSKTFVTAVKTQAGKWEKGAPVVTYTKDGEVFIRTDANETAKDNLGNLPSCS